MKKFMDIMISDQKLEYDIDQLLDECISDWHASDEQCELSEWLALSDEAYKMYVEGKDIRSVVQFEKQNILSNDINKCPICLKKPSKNHEFCSKKCFLKSKRVELNCDGCDKKFTVLKCHHNRKFCSHKCAIKYRSRPSKKFDVECSWCGSRFKRLLSSIRGSRNIFCDKSCYLEFHSRLTVSTSCDSCGKELKVNVKRLAEDKQNFCSRDCYKKEFKGINLSKKFKKGWFISSKAGRVHYNSGLELERFKELDYDNSVVSWSRCDDKITWRDDSGKKHLYNPDLEIRYRNELTIIEEIKGFANKETLLKVSAAYEFYKDTKKIYRIIYDRRITKPEPFIEYYENELGVFHRPRWDNIWMNCATLFAKKSTCNRLAVGALIVDQYNEKILCLGYNGSQLGGKNGCDKLLPGGCGCIHAEANALTKATSNLEGCTMYVTTSPCFACSKLLINRRIGRVVYLKGYRDVSGIRLLRKSDIEVQKYQDLIDFF